MLGLPCGGGANLLPDCVALAGCKSDCRCFLWTCPGEIAGFCRAWAGAAGYCHDQYCHDCEDDADRGGTSFAEFWRWGRGWLWPWVERTGWWPCRGWMRRIGKPCSLWLWIRCRRRRLLLCTPVLPRPHTAVDVFPNAGAVLPGPALRSLVVVAVVCVGQSVLDHLCVDRLEDVALVQDRHSASVAV